MSLPAVPEEVGEVPVVPLSPLDSGACVVGVCVLLVMPGVKLVSLLDDELDGDEDVSVVGEEDDEVVEDGEGGRGPHALRSSGRVASPRRTAARRARRLSC